MQVHIFNQESAVRFNQESAVRFANRQFKGSRCIESWSHLNYYGDSLPKRAKANNAHREGKWEHLNFSFLIFFFLFCCRINVVDVELHSIVCVSCSIGIWWYRTGADMFVSQTECNLILFFKSTGAWATDRNQYRLHVLDQNAFSDPSSCSWSLQQLQIRADSYRVPR